MKNKDDKPAVNFLVLQSVEDYVEKSGKFRTDCTSFEIPGRDSGGASALYIPYCEKQRFDFGHPLNEFRGQGGFTPPETGRPWQIPDFVLFREHFHAIRCPQLCRGYIDKRVVIKNGNPTPRVFKGTPVSSTVDGKWTRKDIIILVTTVVVALLCAVLGWVTPEGRRLFDLDKPQEQHTPGPSTLGDGGPGDTLTQYEPFGELRPDEYEDNDGSRESEDKAKHKVEQRLSHYPDQALVKEADAFCQNLYALVSQWNQEQKEAGSDIGKGLASDFKNILAYSHRSWPEVWALRTVLVPKIPAHMVEQINVKYSSGASLVDETGVNKAKDVESVRQYLKALRDAFVATGGK